MPYYRIVVVLKNNKVVTGIRFLDDTNIDNVQRKYTRVAAGYYNKELVDVEVQMLSKISNAVRAYLDKKKKDKGLDDGFLENFETPAHLKKVKNRKPHDRPSLGEMNGLI
jgi:hypothetical protein